MKTYKITVNGTVYEVDVEEIREDASSSAPSYLAPSSAPRPATSPAPAPTPTPVAKPVAEATTGEGSIDAPMPGTVLDILVGVDQEVEAGQVVLILEAMKMENEIQSPLSGKVIQVNTTKGAAVNFGDSLLVIG